MAERAVIRANGSVFAAVIITLVFGGLAIFGLRIVTLAFSFGETGIWVWGLLAISLAFLWAVVHVLWFTFGVALIISRAGIRRPGPFRGIALPAEGLRVGRYDTTRMGTIGTTGSSRPHKVTELWALSPKRGAVLLLDTARDAPEVERVMQAVEFYLQREVEVMPRKGRNGFD